MVGIYPISLN